MNYGCGLVIARAGDDVRRKRLAVTTAVVVSLGLLCFFKYVGFLQTNLNHLLGLFGAGGVRVLEVALPAGISFYVFHAIS